MIYGKNTATFCEPRMDKFNPALECKPLKALSEAEQAAVAANQAAIYEHMPELVPIIKELHKAGMIDGWRGVNFKRGV